MLDMHATPVAQDAAIRGLKIGDLVTIRCGFRKGEVARIVAIERNAVDGATELVLDDALNGSSEWWIHPADVRKATIVDRLLSGRRRKRNDRFYCVGDGYDCPICTLAASCDAHR